LWRRDGKEGRGLDLNRSISIHALVAAMPRRELPEGALADPMGADDRTCKRSRTERLEGLFDEPG
jgi:hypothetical protein